jgi:AraC-like DNA-binding protein
MHEEIELAALRAIDLMHDRLGDQLTIDDLAAAALFSKFHFSRIFQRVTGLSPGRFLTAIRLQEAKRLLATTPLPVTEISVQVGYSSVGTFSSRFKGSVGVSPTVYRKHGRVNSPVDELPRSGADAAVHGTIISATPDRSVFAGLFPDRILQGRPVRSVTLTEPGPFSLQDVPLGAWHLMARTTTADSQECVGYVGPIVIRPDTRTELADVHMRPLRRLDPPVLLALRS